MQSKPKQKSNHNKPNYFTVSLCVVFPAIIGYLSGDIVIGSLLVATGLLCSYFASIGKRSGYIFGFINALLIAYVAYKNNLFGACIVNTFIFAPLEIYGFISWSRNLNQHKNVKIRKFTFKKSLAVILSCITGSILFGCLLSLIPGQQLAFMDSTIDCLDICALVLLNLRYRENWVLWILSGILSIIVWIIALANGGENAFMRLIAVIGFLIINTYGAIKWYTKPSKAGK